MPDETVKNGVLLQSLHEALDFMRRFAFYSRKQWNYGEESDNYNLILARSKVFVSFTHHGEMLCFAEDVEWLKRIARRFHAYGLSCKIEES